VGLVKRTAMLTRSCAELRRWFNSTEIAPRSAFVRTLCSSKNNTGYSAVTLKTTTYAAG
jgi:hypothetical protein